MSDIKIDLDPKKILTALNDTGDRVKELAREIEEALGKQAPESIGKMEKAAEKGSNDISAYFRNLGKRIKEDLKTAFDIGGLMGGLKIAKELGEGIKQVFDLEKAFDRLNTRLGLSGKAYQAFRSEIGKSVASTGQKLEDIMPGVETAAAKGGVKSPEQLSLIGEALGKVRAATGENTEALSSSVVEILKTQGKAVTAASFKSTLDALQATRTTGAFKTAGEAGASIQAITQGVSKEQLQLMGLDTRKLGGLAAQASRGGEAGQDILQHILKTATEIGGKERLNAVLGPIFDKSGKLDVAALGKVNKQKFGQYSEQVLSSVTGSDQAGLSRFIDSFKSGMGDFNKVVNGSNETNKQFKTATNNLASTVDQFKEKTKNASREIGDGLSTAGKAFLNKDFQGALSALKGTGKAALDNKEVLAGAAGLGLAGALMGGAGAKGLLGSLAGGQAAKAAGIEPVYVTNAAEIGSGVGGFLGKAGLVGGVLAAGGAAGAALGNTEVGGKISKATGIDWVAEKLAKRFTPKDSGLESAAAKSKAHLEAAGLHPEAIKKAVADGFVQGHERVNKNKPTAFSNPSRPGGAGGGH